MGIRDLGWKVEERNDWATMRSNMGLIPMMIILEIVKNINLYRCIRFEYMWLSKQRNI